MGVGAISVAARNGQALTDPRSLPGLELWLDARYPNGIGSAMPFDGDALGTWTDLSGNGRHVTQATAGSRPLWRSGPSKNILTYDNALPTSGWSRRDTTNNTLTYGTGNLLTKITDVTCVAGAAGVQFGGASTLYDITNTAHYASAYIKNSSSTNNISVILYVEYFDSSLGYLRSDQAGSATLTPGQKLAITGQAKNGSNVLPPTGAVKAHVLVLATAATGATDQVTWTQVMLTEGSPISSFLAPTKLPNIQPVVQFDGADDVLRTANMAGWNETTIYTKVHHPVSVSDYQSHFTHRYSDATPNATGTLHYVEPATNNSFDAWSGNGTNWSTATSGKKDDYLWHTWTSRHSLSTNVTELLIDGVSLKKVTTGYHPVGYGGSQIKPINIGAGSDAGTQYFLRGNIATFMLFSELHDDTTRAAVEAYLTNIFGS